MDVHPQIIIIEDKTFFREGFKNIIAFYFGMAYEVISLTEKEFLNFPLTTRIRLIIHGGIYNQKSLKQFEIARNLGSKLVLLILHSEKLPLFMGLKLFDGILLKNMTTHNLLNTLKNILESDHVYLHPVIGYRILQDYVLN